MKAIIKPRPTEPGIEVVDLPIPKLPGDDWVIVRVAFSSISGSEINIWSGKYRLPNGTPIDSDRILGYEHAGIIEDSGVSAIEAGFTPGRRVALGSPFIGCGVCEPCASGFINRCRAWGHIGITTNGTNTLLAPLPMSVLELIDDDIHLLDAAFLNSAALAVRSVDRARLVPGDRAVIVGPGPVGLLMMQAARSMGASWIGVVGLPSDKDRLRIAESLGADKTYELDESTLENIRAETDGLGAEIVLEAAGTPQAMSLAVDLCRVGGTVIYGGLPPEKHAQIEAIRVTRDEITIRGVEGNLPEDRRRALRLFKAGMITAQPLVTHQFSLDEAELAFETVASGKACKAVFRINEEKH